MRVLQREAGRTVALEDDGRTVRKTFHGEDGVDVRQLATSEYERMMQFAQALVGVAHAECAKPVELALGDAPYIRMERARGIPMQQDLGATAWESDRYTAVAGVLRGALIRYIETFGEPYWDFILRNMFYERASETVTFLDFAVPSLYLPAIEELKQCAPLEVSLGALLASSIFEASRPKRILRRREHRQAPVLAQAVLRRCLEDSAGLTVEVAGVRRVAHLAYGLASTGGSWFRQAWYGSYGAVVRPVRRLDDICA